MSLKLIKEFLSSNNKIKIYLILATIAILLLMFIRTDSEENKSSSEGSINFEYESKYEQDITKELVNIISQIKGVGKVSVMLTIESTPVYVYSEDVQKTIDSKKTETVILPNKEALIKRIDTPKVSGVLVVCTGGDNPSVREKVINAVSTVLNISSSKVYVTSSN